MRWVLLLLPMLAFARQPFFDKRHDSKVFGEPRNYRLFLPYDYETSGKSYPVVYYFHGHSDRFTLERYDEGKDTAPRISAYAAANGIIVVAVDGYVARDYTGFYGGSPWDIRQEGGDLDFGHYFVELIGHVDSTYRTLTDRRHRGTSGLSMGGFMSLYLSARYPHLVGSASSFNPGPEFYVGDKGRRSLWHPQNFVSSHNHTKVRLIRASGDYISQYHEETAMAYARADKVDFEYRRDEYHRHFATSIEETLGFHRRAFDEPALNNIPEKLSFADAHKSFTAWDWRGEVSGEGPAITYLEDVTQGGFRIRTRRWAPDGPPAEDFRVTITTAPLYSAGKAYRVLDHHLATGKTSEGTATADREGRLTVTVDGLGHQVSFAGPGCGGQNPVLLPVTWKDQLRLPPQSDLPLPIRVHNPRGEPMMNVTVTLTSAYPTVNFVQSTAKIPRIEPGEAVDVSDRLRVRFVSGGGYFEPARIDVAISHGAGPAERDYFHVLVVPETVPEPAAVEILDGRTVKFSVFRQKGNQGGGAGIERVVTEGKGNGNGSLEPGEEATIWVKIPQGLDPFDKNNWSRAKVYSDSPWITEVADLQEQKQLEWTSAKERTSVIRLSEKKPAGVAVPLLLDNESWTYHYTPDVRYGKERLYQAFQFHRHWLHRLTLR